VGSRGTTPTLCRKPGVQLLVIASLAFCAFLAPSLATGGASRDALRSAVLKVGNTGTACGHMTTRYIGTAYGSLPKCKRLHQKLATNGVSNIVKSFRIVHAGNASARVKVTLDRGGQPVWVLAREHRGWLLDAVVTKPHPD
jgi:hypothetical protein